MSHKIYELLTHDSLPIKVCSIKDVIRKKTNELLKTQRNKGTKAGI